MQYLSILWKIRSIVDRFNRFYSHLSSIDHVKYDKSLLSVGSMISRVTQGESFNLWGIIHCQHFGVVVDLDREEPLILHILSDGVRISPLSEYMGGAKLFHVYHSNPYPDIRGIEKSKYSLLMSNCEHLATLVVDGVARSRQLEVMEHLATSDQDPPEELRLKPKYNLYY